MKFIKVLPEGLIDRIAAGEVIENPASVIKELVENSIDAGARNIDISVTGGGKDEILIVDDGEGIPKDQVELAFYRHATSKIKSWEDLLRTGTMGFRGEALPSISSVSIMELTTHYANEKTGTSIKFDGGKQTYLGPAPPRKGCSISVKNLFYNVPARRKFLKSDMSERRKISEIIRRYIIAHYDIGFKLHIDSKLVSELLPTDNLLNRLTAVWGDGVTNSLVKLNEPRLGPLQVSGYVSKPETNRATRSEIFFLVNKRPVLERAFYGAISASYGHSLPPGRFPYAAIFLDIDPSFVDINVHPAKTEVRFADDGFIFTTMKRSLDKALALPVSFSFRTPSMSPIPQPQVSNTIPFQQAKTDIFENRDFSLSSQQGTITPSRQDSASAHYQPIEAFPPFDLFIQLFDTYMITRQVNGLLIIDQHTAHERILFEKNLDSFDRQGSPSQHLLFEERVKLNPEEAHLCVELSELLTKAGFEIRPFGADEFIISGMPQEMANISPLIALREVLGVYASNLKEGQEVKRALAAALACKAAVKAGHRLSGTEMRGLYQNLLRCRDPYRCPHGRPTIVTMSRDDLEKIFRRK